MSKDLQLVWIFSLLSDRYHIVQTIAACVYQIKVHDVGMQAHNPLHIYTAWLGTVVWKQPVIQDIVR